MGRRAGGVRVLSGRNIAGVTILALWVVVLAVHVQREYFKSETVLLAEGAMALAPGSYFYTVQMDDHAIGMASSRLDTVPEGFRFEELMRLEIPALGATQNAVVQTVGHLGPALQLLDFQFQLDSDVGRFSVVGEVQEDSTLSLRLNAGGQGGTQTSSMRLEPSTTLPLALPLRMAAGGRLESGRDYTARVFDPSAMSDRAVTMTVTGRELLQVPDSVAQRPGGRWVAVRYDTVPTWVVEESYGGVSVTSWLDGDGRLVQAESPMGFTLRRMPYELVNQAWERSRGDPALASGYGSVIESTAIAANAELDPAGVSDLVIRLGNVELEGFDLEGGRQRLNGDTLIIRSERPAQLEATYTLPYTGGGAPEEALEATPLIQVDDERIRDRARRIADAATDPAEVARRLNEWVYGGLRKDITLSIPSAVQVLEMRQGDCNEHTVLYVALARALGLPARTAVGLVHLRGRFYYHAWPEVWLGEDWVAVDPTLGQFPADAAHLRFLNGGLAQQVELIRLIGRLELDIIGTGA